MIMKAICAILTCVGLLVSAVADNPGTQNSRTLLVTADTDEKLLMWQQCGDQAGRWAGKSCDAGACVRVNDWFMQCIPTDNSASVTLVPPNVLQAWEACNAADNPKVSSSSHPALHQMLPAVLGLLLAWQFDNNPSYDSLYTLCLCCTADHCKVHDAHLQSSPQAAACCCVVQAHACMHAPVKQCESHCNARDTTLQLPTCM